MPEKWELRQMQALPLIAKIRKTQLRIREWYEHFDGQVYVSFSGGKDSTVLAHLVHELYPEVALVFSNTGLEYPEIQSFARKMGAEFIRPSMRFDEVISKYGYPLIGKEVAHAICYARRIRNGKTDKEMEIRRKDLEWKRGVDGGVTVKNKRNELDGQRTNGTENGLSRYNKEKWLTLCRETPFLISHYCCDSMKKKPMKAYQRKSKRVPFIGTLAEESRLREQAWLKHGCNSFDATKKTSQPMSFWTEQDVLRYIKENGIEIASVYGDVVTVDACGFEYEPLAGVDCKLKCTGCERTGCIFCAFGEHLNKGKSKFQMLAKTHPRQYEYCIRGGQWADNPNYDPTAPEYDGEWKNWNPKQIWVPSKKGLGMGFVFDQCNQIYGKDFLRYE